MKPNFIFSLLAGLGGLSGCQSAAPIAAVPTTVPPAINPAPVAVATVAPTVPLQIVQGNRSSLPSSRRMMEDTPRPTFVPLPTPKVRPGQTIVISNGRPTPAPRENPTIIISNAPIPGTQITPVAAAARDLVWVNLKVRAYFSPGQRGYGGTSDGFYITRDGARARGYRVAIG